MPDPLTEEQLKGFASIPDILRATRPYAATCIQRLLDEVTRLKAERSAIEAECLSIARQPIGHDAGEIMRRVMALFSPEEQVNRDHANQPRADCDQHQPPSRSDAD